MATLREHGPSWLVYWKFLTWLPWWPVSALGSSPPWGCLGGSPAPLRLGLPGLRHLTKNRKNHRQLGLILVNWLLKTKPNHLSSSLWPLLSYLQSSGGACRPSCGRRCESAPGYWSRQVWAPWRDFPRWSLRFLASCSTQLIAVHWEGEHAQVNSVSGWNGKKKEKRYSMEDDMIYSTIPSGSQQDWILRPQ